jgi:hypothetical protein
MAMPTRALITLFDADLMLARPARVRSSDFR